MLLAVAVAGLGAIVLVLAVSVGVLLNSLRTAERLQRDWKAEAVQQEKVNLARRFEARLQAENLLKLRDAGHVLDEIGRKLDKIGAE